MKRTFAILHFWPARGGFGKRMHMLADSLRPLGAVRRIARLGELARWLRSRELRLGRSSAILYTSLLAPLALLLAIFRPRCPVYYMVRGDEAGCAALAGRRFRALVARLFQRLLAALGCRFVFASRDLRRLFLRRLGRIRRASLLPNTLGRTLGAFRPFDGRVAIVGDFGSVKNIESALAALDGQGFRVDLYGSGPPPPRWRRPWLHVHGHVDDLARRLAESSALVLSSLSEGFPNVLVEAVSAGCGVVAHSGFPFHCLPLSADWRFDLPGAPGFNCEQARAARPLPAVLNRLRDERRDFRRDNPRLIRLLESDWSARVRRAFAESAATFPTAANDTAPAAPSSAAAPAGVPAAPAPRRIVA